MSKCWDLKRRDRRGKLVGVKGEIGWGRGDRKIIPREQPAVCLF